MTTKLGIIMDPIDTLHYKKDSSLAMLWAAQDRGWDLFYMEQSDLYIEDGVAKANMSSLSVYRDPDNYYSLGEKESVALASLDIILMRKDPPFDQEYIYSTYILEAAEKEGVLVVNRPQALRDCNEKVFATHFPEFCPPHLVTADAATIRGFLAKYKDIILKPLDGMGGTSIFRVTTGDPNIGVIIETLTEYGVKTIMAQQFIPEITQGDKRILMVDGEPIPYCLARIPAKGETRGNLAAGGKGVAQPLSPQDFKIARAIGPELLARGILFAGLDVIGNFLTEINVTSPTCIREIDQTFDTDIAGDLMAALSLKLNARDDR